MRTWRVGTVSMGLTLILLGIFLVLSQLLDWKPAYAMLGWWPIILIVLGIEILVYLVRSKEEQPILKYDIFSIFFVAIIGFVGVGFSIVHATGIFEKVYAWTNHEVKTLELPTYETKLDDTIKRIVINSGSVPLSFETSATDELSVFGTYETAMMKGKAPIEKANDYLFVKTKADTLYVTFKKLPETFTPFYTHQQWNATVVVPDDVKVEVKTAYQTIDVYTKTLKNDWTIEHASDVNVKLGNKVDVKLLAEHIDEFKKNDGWKAKKEQEEDEDTDGWASYSGATQFGKGTYTIKVTNASRLKVSEAY